MSKPIASCLIVLAGCADQPPAATAHLEWGGQNGVEYGDGSQPSTRSGPIVACPDWGSQDGPATSVIVQLHDASGDRELAFDCHDGSATFDVAAGDGAIALSETLSGVSVSRGSWSQSYSLGAGDALELGFIDLDFDVYPSSGGGACDGGDDCGGGDPGPF